MKSQKAKKGNHPKDPRKEDSKMQTGSKSFTDNFFDTSKVKSRINNKSPKFEINSYYKPRRLVTDAQTIRKIDADNFEILKKLNTIHRLGGKTDCWNRKFIYTSPPSVKRSNVEKIMAENKALMIKIEQATGMYCTADFMRQWRESRAAQKSSKNAPMKGSKSKADLTHEKTSRTSKKISPIRTIEDSTRPRCYFEIEIESNHRKLGKLIFQLFADIVPKTCENFQSFCNGFDGFSYKDTPFHRIIPGYLCQGGDVTKFTGSGGISIYGDKFDDENFQLKHSERGILSTRSFEKNANNSTFNLTFERLETMDGKRVVFGRVIGGFSALRELERFGTQNGKPVMKIIVSKCGLL